jgi:GNAT superfamily N-acetyltransferase
MDELIVSIRPMTAADRAEVFALAEVVLRPLAEAAGHPELFHEGDFLAVMDRGEVYVAGPQHRPDEIAGYVIVEAEADGLSMRCLCINPAFEGRRVGHRLVEWAEGLAYSRGVGRISVRVAGGDDRSRRLYQDHGFVPAPPGDQPELIVMEKRFR